MPNLTRRVKKLEAARTDASGLVPHTDTWYAFYEEKLRRSVDGEKNLAIHIPLEVTDQLALGAGCA